MRSSAGVNPQRRKVRNGGTLDSDHSAQRQYSRAFVTLGLGHSASKPKGFVHSLHRLSSTCFYVLNRYAASTTTRLL